MAASGEPTTMLTLDVVRRMLSKSNKDAANGVLDMSRSNHFQLHSYTEGGAVKSALSGLIHVRQCENDKEYFTRRVRKIILSGNDLSARGDVGGSLYELRVFRRSIEQVIAVNCQLDSLGWSFEKEYSALQELNLQHNYLTTIPDLSCCPRLKKLNLANNEITGLANLRKCPSTLEYFDLGGNHIRYHTMEYLVKDMSNFQKLDNLLELKMDGNEFTLDFRDTYRQVILKGLGESGLVKLRFLDGPVSDDMIALAKTFEVAREAQDEEEKTLETVTPMPVPVERIRAIEFTGPFKSRFAKIDHLLEQSMSGSASVAMKLMEELQYEASNIAKNQNGVRAESEALFAQGETNVTLKINEFLQKCIALTERRKEMLSTVLHIVAIMARCSGFEEGTDERRLGIACLRQLQDFMSANEETRSLVISVINEELFSTPFSNLDNAKSTFIPDLCEMADRADCPELLVGAIKYLVNRLTQVVHSPGERALIFRTLAVASRDNREDDGASFLLGEEGIANQLVQELLENSPSFEVRIWILQTIRNLCQPKVRHGKKAESKTFADYLAVSKGLHRTLLLDLSNNARTGLQLDAQKPEQLIAVEIDCLTAMLSNSKQAFADLCGAKDPQLFHLLAKYFLPKVPHLFAEAATYRCVRALLQTTFCPISIREDDPSAPARYKKDILDDLQRVVLTNNVANLLEYLREDSVQYADAWKIATRKLEGAPEFKDLREEKLHNLFIAIIDLIAAINMEANKLSDDDGSWKIAAAITEMMNAKGRESRLFACLEIPSDVVKLAAVKCLHTVKLSEFEDDEIHHLVKMLQDVMNVSAGKTEEVIAISLDILTKHCLAEKRNVFQRNFGKAAVDACLRILEMNVTRDTRGMVSESEEKGVLTVACVRFLQAASRLDATARYLASEAICIKADRILEVEDGFAGKVRLIASRFTGSMPVSKQSSVQHDPVLIEVTAAGSQVEHLMKVFMEVSASGPVAPRLLRRVANILMGTSDGVDLTRKVSNSSKEALSDIRNVVRAEAIKERDLSEYWQQFLTSSFAESKKFREREKQHEQFMTALCLENLLDRMDRVLQATQSDSFRPSLSFHEPSSSKLAGRKRGSGDSKAGQPAESLPYLLERHLMSEQERFERRNQLELGGGLRTIPIDLSAAELYEAQRDITSVLEEEADSEFLESTCAAARVIFAALRYGTVETIATAQTALRSPSRFRALVSIFFGSRDHPIFTRAKLGAKFFHIAEAVLEMPPMRRFELEAETKPLQAMMFACADRAMGLLRKRLLAQSRLAPGDECLIAAAMSCCATAALQLEYVVAQDGSERTPEDLFRELVPSSLLASALKLLLYDMTQTSTRRSSPRNMFWETSEDDARENTIRFLSFCLRHSPTHRYAILEHLIRSNITDQFPVRRMLIQELMKRTHKIGSTQRAALEFRLHHDEQTDIDDNPDDTPGSAFLYSTAVAIDAKNRFLEKKREDDAANSTMMAAASPSPSTSGLSSSWNIFAWCTGDSRINEKNVEKSLPKALDPLENVVNKSETLSPADHLPTTHDSDAADEADGRNTSNSLARAKPKKTQLDILWDAVDVPPPPISGERKHLSTWQADRVGPRERVVTFSFVRWFDGGKAGTPGGANGARIDAYNHVLVLTSEKYILFRVENPADADFPQKWTYVWKRPYRALSRLVVAPTRIHFSHRSSDSQPESSASIATVLTPSRSAAKELAIAFLRLNNAWRAVERALNPGLTIAPLACVENGLSDAFRKLNFHIPFEGKRAAVMDRQTRGRDIGFYCEPVHVCRGQQGTWESVVAVLQHDVLAFARKDWSQIVLEPADEVGKASAGPQLQVVAKFEVQSSLKRPELDVRDFDFDPTRDLCATLLPPFPALVLKVGGDGIAIGLVDDLSRTIWKRLLS